MNADWWQQTLSQNPWPIAVIAAALIWGGVVLLKHFYCQHVYEPVGEPSGWKIRTVNDFGRVLCTRDEVRQNVRCTKCGRYSWFKVG